jgi:tyrosyl-tRNA synthetase
METIKVAAGNQKLLDLLSNNKLVASKAEARRLMEQGGVKVDDEVIKNWQAEIEVKGGMVIQVGKRKFVKIEIE